MKNRKKIFETVIHGVFLILGLITVGCVLLITVYLIISGLPAIREIGLIKFLFGTRWASTAADPAFGILPFILTSIYGTAGAILLGVPIGFLTAVYLAKIAPPKIKAIVSSAVGLLAGIPSVVYGLVGMLVILYQPDEGAHGFLRSSHLCAGIVHNSLCAGERDSQYLMETALHQSQLYGAKYRKLSQVFRPLYTVL